MTQPPASTSFAAVAERIAPGLEQVERALQEQLASVSALVGEVCGHILGSGGKRIRPALTLLAGELCGYTGPRCIQVGAACELLHTATLLHDDVVDLAATRRGRAAANVVWGNRRAILGGDFLYARASSMIVEDGDHDVLQVFADAIRSMAEGELLQLERSFDASITERHYFAVIERKSAVLLSTACETGAIVAGVTRAERRRVRDFGRELGIAFQLRDDALDYEAPEATLGKRPCADLREGKVTLPLLLALKRCSPAERDAVAELLKNAARTALDSESSDAVDLGPALEIVARYRGVADTVRRAEHHLARAAAAIAPFSDSRAKQDLLSAARFAVLRDR
ncbi:MAG: polyprenyl synthetase family protein [Myxococcota bacterium]|nr:polyprenyl synthetase family protein [Myxococcota bacterium]